MAACDAVAKASNGYVRVKARDGERLPSTFASCRLPISGRSKRVSNLRHCTGSSGRYLNRCHRRMRPLRMSATPLEFHDPREIRAKRFERIGTEQLRVIRFDLVL